MQFSCSISRADCSVLYRLRSAVPFSPKEGTDMLEQGECSAQVCTTVLCQGHHSRAKDQFSHACCCCHLNDSHEY